MKNTCKKYFLFLSLSFLSIGIWSLEPYLSKGRDAYSKGDFISGISYFRTAIRSNNGRDEEAQYWLTMALSSNKDYSVGLYEANRFLDLFPYSTKKAEILYQKGYMEYSVEDYDAAISTFYDFIEQYKKNNLAASAYFWIAESLYKTGRFDEARTMFSVVVLDYPSSAKFELAKSGLTLIDQAATQVELLKLLKASEDEKSRLVVELDNLKSHTKAEKDPTADAKNAKKARENEVAVKSLQEQLTQERRQNVALYDKITILQMKNEELSTMIANFANESYLEKPIKAPNKKEEVIKVSKETEYEIKRRQALDELLRKAGLLKTMYNEVLEDEKK